MDIILIKQLFYKRYTNNNFFKTVIPPIAKRPCTPNPCGINARCTASGTDAICTCIANFFGNPLSECRPGCVTSSSCPLLQACVNQKCIDPCPGSCGTEAICTVINHNPVCSCPNGYIGDPFIRCSPKPQKEPCKDTH